VQLSSKKGISAHQFHRTVRITYKSAWFMCHRIRKAMEKDPIRAKLTGTVEADETYVGGKGTGTSGSPMAGDSKSPSSPSCSGTGKPSPSWSRTSRRRL